MTDRGGALYPLAELTRARLIEFYREPEAIFWVFVFPVLLAVALGIAFRQAPNARYRVGVIEADLATHLRTDEQLEIEVVPLDEALAALGRGRLDVVVEAGTRPEAPPVYHFDPARPDSRAAQMAVDRAVQISFGRRDPAPAVLQPVTAAGSRYIDFLIPGIIGLNLMGSSLWGIGFSIVVARSRRLLKRFAATPMRRSHYLLAYVLSRMLFLILEVAAISGLGWLIFGVAIRGPLIAVLVVTTTSALAFAGLALLIAARPETIESVSGWMNLVMLPQWLLSGSFFSYERFPEVTWPVIKLLPLTATNDALRAVFRGEALFTGIGPELAVLAAWGGLCLAVAVRRFRWQ
jgi:ABC-2 type transport system permease protein